MDTPNEDDAVPRLWIALAKTSRFVERQVSGGDMSHAQLSTLATIARLREVGVGELADIEGLNPTMLSRIIGKLEASGLAVRTQDPQDRRAIRIAVTPAGRKLHERLRRERTALFAERLGELPADSVALLVNALPALESLANQLRRRPAVTVLTETLVKVVEQQP
jgi:DNA-binding MarR family transcriptional regulator